MREGIFMPKIIPTEFGVNLGYIDKIILVDGTVLENCQVLYNSPIPNTKQIEIIFAIANETSKQIIGAANHTWSAQPDIMIKHSFFGGAN
jgi:hypothetical protein